MLRLFRRMALCLCLFLALVLFLGCLALFARLLLGDLLLHEIVAVIAEVLRELAVLELQGAVRDLVEEVAVMRDGQECAGERHERFLDGLARRDVEVVRRLIEHEEIRTREHELEEGHARLLAAGEVADAA